MARETFRDFVAHHDDRWLFVIVYIGLAVVLSIVLSLFWLVAVAGLHFGLEYLRQAQVRRSVPDIVTHAVWEIKLDIALVLLALAMALYMDVVMGVLGLQSAARAAAATRVTRVAAWERNLRAVVLLSDDLARMVQIGYTRFFRRSPVAAAAGSGRGGERRAPTTARITTASVAREASVPAGPTVPLGPGRSAAPRQGGVSAVARPKPRSWREPWSRGDRFTLALLAASLLLIVIAPMLTDHSWSGAAQALLGELHPFPPK